MLISLDIDGTMEFGDPPGPVPAGYARALIGLGHIVGVASDWPLSQQEPLWARHGVSPHFFGGKHNLAEVRSRFEADRYLHIGDTEVDESYALAAGFEFVHVTRLPALLDAALVHELMGRRTGQEAG